MKKKTETSKTKKAVGVEQRVMLQNGGKGKNWERTVYGNVILECDNFFISYRGNTAELGSIFAGDDGGYGETALCFDGKYKILNGDFRKEYEKIVDKGLEECLKFYNSKNAECASCWSND